MFMMATIMIWIIAEKDFEACLPVREEKLNLIPLTTFRYPFSGFLHFPKFLTKLLLHFIHLTEVDLNKKKKIYMTEQFDMSHLKKYILGLIMIRLQTVFL